MSSIHAIRDKTGLFVPLTWGGLLFVAALLKSKQWLIESELNDYSLSHGHIQLSLIGTEILLGTWLVSGVAPRVSRWLAITLFSLFAITSLLKVWAGETSCGCFGPIAVDPRLTFTLDVIAMLTLWLWKPKSKGPATPTNVFRMGVAAMALLLVGISLIDQLSGQLTSRIAEDGTIDSSTSIVVLEPEEWLGQPLPIAAYLKIDAELMAGRWTLVLYHHDCPKCQESLPKYEELAATFSEEQENRIAIIEVPPYGSTITTPNEWITHGRLSQAKEWFVEAPVEIVLENGIVKLASLDLPSIAKNE